MYSVRGTYWTSESLHICIVPSVARAIRGWLEGSLKSNEDAHVKTAFLPKMTDTSYKPIHSPWGVAGWNKHLWLRFLSQCCHLLLRYTHCHFLACIASSKLLLARAVCQMSTLWACSDRVCPMIIYMLLVWWFAVKWQRITSRPFNLEETITLDELQSKYVFTNYSLTEYCSSIMRNCSLVHQLWETVHMHGPNQEAR